MSYSTSVFTHITTLEHEKFAEILNDSRFPATTGKYIQMPESSAMPPITSYVITNKAALLSYVVNTEDFGASGQRGVVIADSTSGNVTGTFSTFTVLSTTRIQGISASGGTSSLSNITKYDLPANFTLNGPITAVQVTYGAIALYVK